MEFEEVIDKYSGIITKICYYFASNVDEFKDIRQDVWINIWKGRDKFRNESSLSTWIYRVSFNTCISYQRKNKLKTVPLSIETLAEIPDNTDFDISKYNEMHRLINSLSLRERAIILMWLDEKSYDEIAEITGMPRNTIAVKLKRIKEKLVKLSNQ